jgi:hypothetical protein
MAGRASGASGSRIAGSRIYHRRPDLNRRYFLRAARAVRDAVSVRAERLLRCLAVTRDPLRVLAAATREDDRPTDVDFAGLT